MTITEKNLLNINLEKIRSEIPSLKNIVFFNSGWTGPTPKSVLEAIQTSIQNQIQCGPSSKDAVKAQVQEMFNAKSKIAQCFSTSSDNICLTPNTTFGINIALNGYNWKIEDEIVTTKHEHASVLIPLYNLKQRYNIKIKLIDLNENDPLRSFKDNLSKDTKAAVFSHVYWTTGFALSGLKEIIKVLRESDVISVIDAAQSVGALKINLDDLGPDFYAAPGQKWLLGPVGTGFLYVSKNLLGKRPPWPTVVGYESAGDASDDGQYDLSYNWNPKKNAGVFEFGGLNNSLFCGFDCAIDFAGSVLKEFDMYKRVQVLADYLIEKLSENSEIKVVTPSCHAGLVSWQHKKISSREIVSKLWKERRILIREIPNLNYCRASVHYFNTKEEIDLLVDALDKLLSS